MIVFPTTPEAFISYQEQLARRPLSGKEKELAASWVECFNLSYEDGLKRDRSALDEILAFLDGEMMNCHTGHSGVNRFIGVCRVWIEEAWAQGREREQHPPSSGYPLYFK